MNRPSLKIGHWALGKRGVWEVWEVWEDVEEIFPPTLPTLPHLSIFPSPLSPFPFPLPLFPTSLRSLEGSNPKTLVKNYGSQVRQGFD